MTAVVLCSIWMDDELELSFTTMQPPAVGDVITKTDHPWSYRITDRHWLYGKAKASLILSADRVEHFS